MSTYKNLTIAEHIALGNKLKVVWSALSVSATSFPKNSPITQASRRAEKAMLSLKSRLDDEICRLVKREQDPRHLAIKVYYGSQLVENAGPHESHDAFAGWAREER